MQLFFLWLHWVLVAAGRIFVAATGFSLVAVHRLSCPGACGILVPPPEIEPMSPALEGGFLTTGPPGKALNATFKKGFMFTEIYQQDRKSVV